MLPVYLVYIRAVTWGDPVVDLVFELLNWFASLTLTDFEGEDYDAALLEEQEAKALQRKLAEQMQEDDLGLNIFKVT